MAPLLQRRSYGCAGEARSTLVPSLTGWYPLLFWACVPVVRRHTNGQAAQDLAGRAASILYSGGTDPAAGGGAGDGASHWSWMRTTLRKVGTGTGSSCFVLRAVPADRLIHPTLNLDLFSWAKKNPHTHAVLFCRPA